MSAGYNRTCHDGSVRRRAAGLEANGWNVKAAVQGYDSPPKLNGSVPDIFATKGKRTRIVEVETVDTKRSHREQHKRLRDYGKGQSRTEVQVRTCFV